MPMARADDRGGYCWGVTDDLPALYRLGIVGAGQIARMMHQSAVKLGITPRLFAERFDDSAALAAPEAVFNHPDALAGFAADCGHLGLLPSGWPAAVIGHLGLLQMESGISAQ